MKVESKSATLRGGDAVFAMAGVLLSLAGTALLMSFPIAWLINHAFRGGRHLCDIRRRAVQTLAVRDGVRDLVLRQGEVHVPEHAEGEVMMVGRSFRGFANCKFAKRGKGGR